MSFELSDTMRNFSLTEPANVERLLRRLAYFKTVDGRVTDYYRLTQFNRTKSVNQYLTHWIYPYKGKFHPQMIRALLNILQLTEKDTVLDPFVGSGTTAVEAQLLGIKCVGIDISPLSVLQTRVKTLSSNVVDRISPLKREAISAFPANSNESPETKKDYEDFLETIDDDKAKEFYEMAKLLAISDRARRRRNLAESFKRNLDSMIDSVEDFATARKQLNLSLGAVNVQKGDSRQLPLKDESVQGIITSPPYSIALDYVANDAHAFAAMGYDIKNIKSNFIGVRDTGESKIRSYNQDMIRSYEEMHRVLETGKSCAIVIGDATYQGTRIESIAFTIEQCRRLGFKLEKNMNKIIHGLYNVMQTDNTLIFRKEK